MCRRRWDMESASLVLSISSSCVVGDETGNPCLSRALSLSLSSTRDGWVCSCALVDGRRRDTESASIALSSSCVVGDETWNPRVRSLRGAYTKIPSLLHSSSVIFARWWVIDCLEELFSASTLLSAFNISLSLSLARGPRTQVLLLHCLHACKIPRARPDNVMIWYLLFSVFFVFVFFFYTWLTHCYQHAYKRARSGPTCKLVEEESFLYQLYPWQCYCMWWEANKTLQPWSGQTGRGASSTCRWN
jgi:hypothetical protein